MSKGDKNMKTANVSLALKELRELHELSIRKLAQRLNLSPTRVHQMESGKEKVSDDYIRLFLNSIDFSLAEWKSFLNEAVHRNKDFRNKCHELIKHLAEDELPNLYELLLLLKVGNDHQAKIRPGGLDEN